MSVNVFKRTSLVPNEYQEVEYIAGNGNPYIDTGIKLSSSDTVKCKFEITAKPADYSYREGIYGTMETIGGNNTFFVLLMRTPTLARVGTSSNQVTSTDIQLNRTYDTTLSNGTYIENGTTYTFTPHNGFTFNTNCYLFKRNQSSMLPTSAKVYSFEIVGKFNGVPCYRKADNVIGMYDTVSQTFFTNAGSGNFTAGQSVSIPNEYQQVEYIQMDSTAPETTGILLNINYTDVAEIRVKYEMLNELGYLGSPMILCSHTANSFSSSAPYTCANNSSSGNLFNTNYTTKDDINNPKEFIINARTTSSGLIKIGGWNDAYWTAIGRYYYVKLLDANYNTIMNLLPCYRKADGVIGLYDTINDVFYINGGTGTFTKGSDVGGSGFEATRTKAVIFNANPNRHNLPSEYQEVEYIESTGTQYIDTGIVPNTNTKIEAKVSITQHASADSYDSLFGTIERTTTNAQIFDIQISPTNYFYFSSGEWGVDNISVTSGLNTEYNISFSVNGQITVNGNSYTLTSGWDNTNSLTLSIFALHYFYDYFYNNYSYMKLYLFAIYDGNTLVRNLIPCYRKSDNEVGLYDTVNDVFYTNAGTGTFLKGDDVVSVTAQKVKMAMLKPNIPSAYQEVEYLESNGTQYIDTGVKPENIGMELTIQLISASDDQKFFGSYGSSGGIVVGTISNSWRIGDPWQTLYSIPATTNKTNISYHNGIWSFNGVTVEKTITNYSSYNIILCGINYDGIIRDFTSLKVYGLKLYQSNILVRDLVPAVRKSDNEIGLYDKVTDTFYTNAGTGDFTKGNNVNNYDIIRI